MRKLALVLPLLALNLNAQVERSRKYYFRQTASLTAAAFAVTVQQPASAARAIQFDGAYVRCTAATTVTLEKNGTAATTTTGTVLALDERGPAATAGVFTASNVGAGTGVIIDTLAANEKWEIKGGLYLPVVSGSRKNFTVKSTAITATCEVYVQWSEPQ